jgi:hypothetical protein
VRLNQLFLADKGFLRSITEAIPIWKLICRDIITDSDRRNQDGKALLMIAQEQTMKKIIGILLRRNMGIEGSRSPGAEPQNITAIFQRERIPHLPRRHQQLAPIR